MRRQTVGSGPRIVTLESHVQAGNWLLFGHIRRHRSGDCLLNIARSVQVGDLISMFLFLIANSNQRFPSSARKCEVFGANRLRPFMAHRNKR